MLTAAHLKTKGLSNEWTARAVEAAIRRVAGVARVVTSGSLGIVSVMWDDTVASLDQIVRALRAAGFDAHPVTPMA